MNTVNGKRAKWEWITRRLPMMPKWRTEQQLMRLTKKALAERVWAAEANADHSMYAQSEAWALLSQLVEMVDGKRPMDRELVRQVREHRAHVIECRMGSCEHEYAALVKAKMV